MKIQRLSLMMTHFRNFTTFADYNALIRLQANNYMYVSKRDIRRSNDNLGRTSMQKTRGVKR